MPSNPNRDLRVIKTSKRGRRLGLEKLEPRQVLAANVVINEIHFDPDDSTEQVEFLELYNDSGAEVDLSGWVIDDAVDFTFPDGVLLPIDGYVVVTQNSADFETKYGGVPAGEWQLGDRLSNEGENIQLRDSLGEVVDEVNYQLGFPWPTVGAAGASIELIHPSLDNNLAGSWRASSGDSGLPSTPITLLAAEDENWHYRKGTSEASSPTDAWRFPDFVEDVTWQTGQTSIGYGDADDNTIINDMRFNYTSMFLRNTFTITGAVPSTLKLGVYVDDGAMVWINGERVGLYHVEDTELTFDDLAFNHDTSGYEERILLGASQYLNEGENTIAIHALNSSITSSDFSIDAELIIPAAGEGGGVPSPGERNGVFNTNAAPQLRQLSQSVLQPTSGEDVVISIKATDPDLVDTVTLDYQLVDPGNYIRLGDAAYDTNWTTVVMRDDGLNGDLVAGDDVYSVTLSASLQQHRRLVRYRVTATDMLGTSVTGPYADDPQPNFAYFVYDGVPDYEASLRPGVEQDITYAGDKLDDIATYHLIANSTDVGNSQWNGSFNLVQFNGTLVYEGIVYDHIEFRNRGRGSTYFVGKNKWKINFTRGHSFQARDDFGNIYDETWDKINILPGTNPWWRDDVSTDGTVLYEPVAFKLYELAGTPAPSTQYMQFRIIDNASESGVSEFGGDSQYGGDFWGLYIGIEQPDGRFLDERGLPDGNIFNMHGGAFGATSQRSQGSELPTDRSDLQSFLSGIDGGFESLQWWEENLNWDSYFAWNIINHAVNNSDIRNDENVNYYHNQENDQWYILPWDLDLTFEDAPHHGTPVTPRERIRTLLEDHPVARIAYENRLRELQDLLFDNNDAALVVEEFANVLTLGTGDQTIVDANQTQWDYHPRKNKKGIWYENFNPSLLPSEDFAGLTTYMQDFLNPGGYGYQLVDGQGDDSGIPNQPTISYVGLPMFARDGLEFQTTPFSDPQGAGTFAAMEWRVAEVHNSSVANYDPARPYVYETEEAWESGAISTFDNQIAIPATAIEAGKTYRARVRMQDATGRWSHWSAAEEFLATPAVANDAQHLRITELHYNPAEPSASEVAAGYANNNDFEFIELWNSSVDPIEIQFAAISGGVDLTFEDSTILSPGERAVVVEDQDAFELRYGTSIRVVGQWSGALSNGGEMLTLRDQAGGAVHELTYEDGNDPGEEAWPTSPDGDGPSLVVIDTEGDYNDGGNWHASTSIGGTPGSDETQPVVGDYDQDGMVSETDYALWAMTFDSTTDLRADGNGDFVVNMGDYAIWRDNLPTPIAALTLAIGEGTNASQPLAAVWPLEVGGSSKLKFNSASIAAVDQAMETAGSNSTPDHLLPVDDYSADTRFATDQVLSEISDQGFAALCEFDADCMETAFE